MIDLYTAATSDGRVPAVIRGDVHVPQYRDDARPGVSVPAISIQ